MMTATHFGHKGIGLVCFDVGHTVVWPRYGKLATDISECFGQMVTPTMVMKAEQEFRKHVAPFSTEDFSMEIPIPDNSVRYYSGLVCGALNRKPEELDGAFKDFCISSHRFHLEQNWFMVLGHDAIEALEMLRGRFRLGVISNAHGTVERDLRLLGINGYFSFVIDSQAVGLCKPDPEIFRLALRKGDVSPEQAIHVGDQIEADVKGARAIGMHAALYDAQGIFRGIKIPGVPYFRNLVDLAEYLLG